MTYHRVSIAIDQKRFCMVMVSMVCGTLRKQFDKTFEEESWLHYEPEATQWFRVNNIIPCKVIHERIDEKYRIVFWFETDSQATLFKLRFG